MTLEETYGIIEDTTPSSMEPPLAAFLRVRKLRISVFAKQHVKTTAQQMNRKRMCLTICGWREACRVRMQLTSLGEIDKNNQL
jgi:hypothetical protein